MSAADHPGLPRDGRPRGTLVMAANQHQLLPLGALLLVAEQLALRPVARFAKPAGRAPLAIYEIAGGQQALQAVP